MCKVHFIIILLVQLFPLTRQLPQQVLKCESLLIQPFQWIDVCLYNRVLKVCIQHNMWYSTSFEQWILKDKNTQEKQESRAMYSSYLCLAFIIIVLNSASLTCHCSTVPYGVVGWATDNQAISVLKAGYAPFVSIQSSNEFTGWSTPNLMNKSEIINNEQARCFFFCSEGKWKVFFSATQHHPILIQKWLCVQCWCASVQQVSADPLKVHHALQDPHPVQSLNHDKLTLPAQSLNCDKLPLPHPIQSLNRDPLLLPHPAQRFLEGSSMSYQTPCFEKADWELWITVHWCSFCTHNHVLITMHTLIVRSPDAETTYLSSKSTTLTAARWPTSTLRRLMSVGDCMSQTAIERSWPKWSRFTMLPYMNQYLPDSVLPWQQLVSNPLITPNVTHEKLFNR